MWKVGGMEECALVCLVMVLRFVVLGIYYWVFFFTVSEYSKLLVHCDLSIYLFVCLGLPNRRPVSFTQAPICGILLCIHISVRMYFDIIFSLANAITVKNTELFIRTCSWINLFVAGRIPVHFWSLKVGKGLSREGLGSHKSLDYGVLELYFQAKSRDTHTHTKAKTQTPH